MNHRRKCILKGFMWKCSRCHTGSLTPLETHLDSYRGNKNIYKMHKLYLSAVLGTEFFWVSVNHVEKTEHLQNMWRVFQIIWNKFNIFTNYLHALKTCKNHISLQYQFHLVLELKIIIVSGVKLCVNALICLVLVSYLKEPLDCTDQTCRPDSRLKEKQQKGQNNAPPPPSVV